MELEGEATLSFPWPAAYLEFLSENGLDPSIYAAADSIPPYIWPGLQAHPQKIEAEISYKLEKVAWLPNFLSFPPHIQIANSKAYQEGKIYGIDAASGAAVSALDIKAGDHVLDLCAAPGAKPCMILDFLGSSGSVAGVDIARSKLPACRTMLQNIHSLLQKPSQMHIRNGRQGDHGRKGKEILKQGKNVASSSIRKIQEPELIFYGKHSGVLGLSKKELYQVVGDSELLLSGNDKVFVDAECTHDGSIRHIQKLEYWGWLQLELLTNEFRLLKLGGSLVYSSCRATGDRCSNKMALQGRGFIKNIALQSLHFSN